MVIYEQDSDVVQWGLHLFDTDSVYSSTGYYGDMTQNDANDMYHEQYFRDHYDTDYSHIENDETIAHALQEEFSQLDIAEGSRYSHAQEDHLQPSLYSQDWLNPSTGNYYSGHDRVFEQADDTGTSSQCSSPGNVDERYSCLELTDEYELDGEVGKRLNQMIPIRHVPRINGEIPSTDEATSDYQRLLDRLQLYDLVEHKVQGDGNCQFRALSDQLFKSPEHHKVVRQQVVNQLKSHSEIYEGYVPMAYDDYLEKMSKSGEWGDHVTLQAAADSYGVKIFVITSFKDTCYIEILPNDQKSKRVIFLSFWAEVHYNSIIPPGDILSGEFRKKKWWWIFGHKQ